MAILTVIRIFVLTIFFNTILPTGDVYSDVLLMVETWTFQNTNSLEMVGCRACFGKTEDSLYSSEKDCETCITKNSNFYCGFYIPSMKKLHEIESRKKCLNEKWGMFVGSLDGEQGECDIHHHECCFESRNNTSEIRNNDEQKMKLLQLHPRFLVNCDDDLVKLGLRDAFYHYIVSYDSLYNECLLAGKAMGSHCSSIVYKTRKKFYSFYLIM